MLADDGVTDSMDGLSAAELVQRARQRGLVTDATVNAVDGLRVMHMLAVLDHGGRNVDTRRAEEFITLAGAVLYTLRVQTSANQSRHP